MLKKILGEVVVLIVGKQAEEIASLLDNPKHVNEFIIAKKLDMTINQTRNILYKISDHGLVSFIRKKDKRKGWYTYFWKIEVLKALEFYKETLIKKRDQITNQINSRETKEFYVCELCNVEYNEENALIRDFTCSECGNVFAIKDNSLIIKELKKVLIRINSELEDVEVEIEKENQNLEKKIKKEAKKVEKKKKELKKAVKKKKELEKVAKKEKPVSKKTKKPGKKVVKKLKKKIQKKKPEKKQKKKASKKRK